MNKVSIIITSVVLDEDQSAMTAECVRSFERTMNRELDEVIEVVDVERKGNAWAWNEGERSAKGNILLFSDNDIVAIDWRDKMVDSLSDFSIVFPQVFNLKNGQLQNHLSGECWMVEKRVFDGFGGIDETYGSYFEDTDFFMRVQQVGNRLSVAPGTLVTHRSKGTFSKLWTEEEMKEKFEKNKAIYEARFGGSYPFLN